MKKFASILFISLFFLACSNHFAEFNGDYEQLMKTYKTGYEKIETKVQLDSLKQWLATGAKTILKKYKNVELNDTLLVKWADLLQRSGESAKALETYKKAFISISAVQRKWVSNYLRLLIAGDLMDAGVRASINDLFDKYDEVLGQGKISLMLNYGYSLSEKGIYEDAKKAFDVVIASNKSASMTGQGVLENAAILFEEKGVSEALNYLHGQRNNHPENKMIKEKIVQFSLIGKKAPALKWVFQIGDRVDLKKLRGKVTLIDFWAPWCGPCRRAFPELKNHYTQFNKRGFNIIGATNYYPYYRDERESIQNISHEDYQKKLLEFKKRHQLPWDIAVANDKINRKNFGVSFIPTFFLVDKKGIVRYAQVGSKSNEDILRNKIESLLK